MNELAPHLPSFFTVTELNQGVQALLEMHFEDIWITGEVSNLVAPQSGHLYFSLKDPTSQLRAALFKNRNSTASAPLKNGMQILARGQLSLYTPRGDYQFIVREWQLVGHGMLEWQFQQLKEKLSKNGLFDPTHKKPIPMFPKMIGIVTSATGAALQDILNVLKRRMPLIPIRVYPTLVQGTEAASQIVRAIEQAQLESAVDTLILARGGGSLEDLWPFNEEKVATAIHNCPIPIISGIGHEIDFTIADFVADLRAPTPSAAAELVAPDQQDIQNTLRSFRETFQQLIQRLFAQHRREIQFLTHRLDQNSPKRSMQIKAQRLDELRGRLLPTFERLSTRWHQRLHAANQLLKALSPFATLDRGYAIVHDAAGHIIDSAAEAQNSSQLKIQFKDGSIGVKPIQNDAVRDLKSPIECDKVL